MAGSVRAPLSLTATSHAYLLHKSRNITPEVAIVERAFAKSKGDFLRQHISGEVSSQFLAELVNEVVGAKGGACHILDVFAMATSVDAHAITHDMFHYVIVHGAAKEQPCFVDYSLARLEAQRGEVFAAIGKSPGEVEVGRGLLVKGLLGRALHAQQGCCAHAHAEALVVARQDLLHLLRIGVLG